MKRLALLVVATAIVIACTAASSVAPAPRRVPLAPVSRAQMRSAGIGGTGCFWMATPGGPVRMAMADERATVSIDGRLIVLSPDRGAHEMFPFTFDGWRSANRDLTIAVAIVGPSRREGGELLTSRATLTVYRSGRRTVLIGWMECGS